MTEVHVTLMNTEYLLGGSLVSMKENWLDAGHLGNWLDWTRWILV